MYWLNAYERDSEYPASASVDILFILVRCYNHVPKESFASILRIRIRDSLLKS